MKPICHRFFIFVLLMTNFTNAAEPPGGAGRARIPVILVTDIGTDIDDTWALAHVLRSPELDLKLVLTDSGDTRYRALVAAKFLQAAGRSDVPIGLGKPGTMGESEKNVAPWIVGYDLAKYPGKIHEDGIAAMIEVVAKATGPVTIIAVGPVPSLPLVLEKAPDLAAKCRFVGMYGSFDKGYGGGAPVAEANVKGDPAALRKTLAAPWRDVLLTPLDTCSFVKLDGANYHAIWSATGDPMLRALIEGYCVFAPRVTWMRCDFFAIRSTTLFDCVAVYLAYAENLVETETLVYEVTDDGFTRRSPNGPLKARVALRWKSPGLPAFEDHLAQRLLKRD
jgi:inosine-uridine nucleoside N-ribohydrolase